LQFSELFGQEFNTAKCTNQEAKSVTYL
jgi:hypothetical protein